MSNWQSLLEPSSEPQDWLLYITGGNKTCFGRCGNADKAFNVRTQIGVVEDPSTPTTYG
jgi:PTH2 family peptidyl-tRNA hydrolase